MELAESGEPPAPLLKQPDISDAEAGLLRAFLDLHACRSQGFNGANPISATDIAAYWLMSPITGPARFFAVVKKLDSVFLAWQRENAPRD